MTETNTESSPFDSYRNGKGAEGVRFNSSSFLSETSPRYTKTEQIIAAAAISIGAGVGLPQVYYNSTEIANTFKSEGPYEHSDGLFPDTSEMFERTEIPALPASDALRLDDDFDGLFETRGYNIMVDAKRLRNTLEPNQMAIVTIEQELASDTAISAGMVVVSPESYQYFQDSDLYYEAFDRWPVPQTMFGNGYSDGYESKDISSDFISVSLDGVSLQSQDPVAVKVETIVVDEQQITAVEERTTAVHLVQNQACEDGEQFTSETYLTASQKETVCAMFEQYGSLLQGDYAVYLDAINADIESSDSVTHLNERVQLTYPYIGEVEVSSEEFSRVALHELMHVTTDTAHRNSIALYLQADFSFTMLNNATNYKIPSPDVINTYSQTAADVEPVWAIITESDYIEGDSTHGHPWDNATEMVSSTVSVLAYFPDEFIEKYKNLNTFQQAAVRNASLTAKGLIEEFDVPVTQIIPEWERISEELNF